MLLMKGYGAQYVALIWAVQLTGPPVMNEHSVLNSTSINDVRKGVLRSILVPSIRKDLL